MSESGAVRAAILLRVDCSPDPIRLASVFGAIAIPANALDPDGADYIGFAILSGLPELNQVLNGASDRVGFTLSGVPAEIALLAEGDAEAIDGVRVNVGLLMLDEDWQPDGDPAWLWEGAADVLKVAMVADQDGNQTHTVQLSAAASFAGRARPDYATWTDAQHQRAHPGDTFLNQVPTSEKQKRWPGG